MGEIINPNHKKITKVTTEFFGRELSLEINRVGFRSTASVIARYGDTVVLATAMVSKHAIKGFDYFPLSIEYEEKFYASGKISGSRFIKREGRPSDEAILIGRIIDRPIRPLWPKGYRNEVQGVATVLSMDPHFRPDMIAMIALSAAFMITGAPFDGPVAGLRVGLKDGKPTAFMTKEDMDAGGLDLVVAGKDGAIMMVEAGASEVSEDTILDAMAWAEQAMQPALDIQRELVKVADVQKQEFVLALPSEEIQKKVDSMLAGKLAENVINEYPKRHEILHEIREKLMADLLEELGEEGFEANKTAYQDAFGTAINKDVRKSIIDLGKRPDGRPLTEVRTLSSQVGLLPRAHGSSIFTRGMTQALNIVTLAPMSYAQMVETMEFSYDKRYMHHYNAPGYTVGEIKRIGSPGRREIGHSYLAERALLAVMPSEADFPYTIRSVTEIMSQHGSTSMAATCSSCLALMDAGVPLKAPVSGIAMGLIIEGDKVVVLSDIADAEDFAGDMDFKVTGTKNGVTAMQMDMKVHGLPMEILRKAVMQSREGRAHILAHMLEIIDGPRKEMSPYAPRVESIMINPDKIREVIGKGGEMINSIIAESGAEIDIKDDGLVMVSSADKASIDIAMARIKSIVAEPEIGMIYRQCRVVTLTDFGAFVEIMPGKEGLLHISEISDKRIDKVSDILKVGDLIDVRLVAIGDRGKMSLTMKNLK